MKILAKHAQTDAGQRVKRTAFAVSIAAVVAIVLALPEVLQLIADDMGEFLPPHLREWLLGAAAVTAALAALITKLMTLKSLEGFFAGLGLGKAPERDEIV